MHGEGFLDKLHPLVQYAMVGDDVGGVAAHKQALEVPRTLY